jgi:MFS family permease
MMLKRLVLPKNVQRCYRLDSAAAVFQGLFTAAIFPFVAVIAVRLGASDWLISLLVASTYFGYLLTIPTSSIMGGRRKFPFLIWLGIIHKAIILWLAFVIEPWLFVLVIVLFHLFENFTGPAYISLIHAMYPEKVRGKLTGRVWTFGLVAALISTFVAGYLLDLFSYRIVFPVAALFGITSTIIFMNIRVKEPVEKRKSLESLFHIFSILKRDKKYVLYLISDSVAETGYLILLPIFPIFLVKVLALTNFEVGILMAVQSLFTVLTLSLWGRRIDTKGPYRTMVESFAFVIPAAIVFFFSHSIYVVWIAFMLFGICSGGLGISVINLMGRFTTKKRITDYFSLYQTMSGIRGSIFPFLSSLLLVYISIRNSFLIAAAILLVGVILLAFTGRKQFTKPHTLK